MPARANRPSQADVPTNTIQQHILNVITELRLETSLAGFNAAIDLHNKYTMCIIFLKCGWRPCRRETHATEIAPQGKEDRPCSTPPSCKASVSLITGGGTGLGKEMAIGFAALGAHVYICGRRKDVLDQAAREIREISGGRTDA